MCREVNRMNTVRLCLADCDILENYNETLASNFSGTFISPREERFCFLHGNKKKGEYVART